ncbi:5-oxoprolinase subunit C family protein [Rubrivivax gelatinosus]|uniref:Biotin-dependent carboxylase-like uncharacterized protein n=1 Tax=Rubrivivax gelatinosus TaxID=28068 RepID=A0A4R2M6P9_RUBGE|nr:biotin-dependent carboxyltransferase family protein [Rubrivivax gelatinosus]MBK1687397.1 hypothetical protein [Rubrivivax gelatinosus]TCO99843.1 biotin-dependent carboxylase-like uncharacterized protein [Rubrivivax gelatinosus]
MNIEVVEPGLQTLLQDEGRWGWQHEGVPVGGAMDGWSHRLANLLVGNAADEATLEILLKGPTLRFECAARIAVTGAELGPVVDGRPVPSMQALDLPAGAVLGFGAREAGLRAYLAVAGGFDLAPVLGSRSTYARGGFGGLDGRALRAGDRLPLRRAAPPHAGSRPLAADLLAMLPDPAPDACATLAVLAGEHWGAFSPEAQQSFLSQDWRIGAQSDRMGYRLQGRALAPARMDEMLSEGVAFGTVQLPPDGQPIVLMADRHGTGGYPKIAHVAAVDLPMLAQLAPGQRVRFELVTLDLAQALIEDRERRLQRLRLALLGANDGGEPAATEETRR